MKNLLKGGWTCSLTKNDTLIGEIECKNIQSDQHFIKRHPELFGWIILGAAFGAELISLTALIVLLAAGITVSTWNMRRWMRFRKREP